MLTVSTQWHEASTAQFRYQAYLKASLSVAPPGLREGAVASSSATHAQSDASTLIDGRPTTPYKYVTLEANRWLLNSTQKILHPDTQLLNWWSNLPVAKSQPVLRFDFDQAYTIPGLFVTWDLETNSCPHSFQVLGYDSRGVQQYAITVTGVTSVSGFYETVVMDNVQRVDIKVLDWAVPSWRARLSEVTFGLIVDFDSVNNGRITSATVTNKTDILARQLPTHTADVYLRNIDRYLDPTLTEGISKYLAVRQVMKLHWEFTTSPGVVEQGPEMTYLVESFKIPPDSKDAEMHVTNRLALLTNTFKHGDYTGAQRSLYTIAQHILENSDVFAEFEGQQAWELAPALRNFNSVAPVPALASNELLQLIAAAGCCWLTTRSTDGFILFKQAETHTNDHCAVGLMQELGDPEITVDNRLRSITTGVYSYTTAGESSEVGKGEYTLAGTHTLTIQYSVAYATEVSASVTGATFVRATYTATHAFVTLTAPAAGASVTVTLTGREIKQTVTFVETFRDTTVTAGRDITIENPFITSVAHAQQVSDYAQGVYSRRNSYKVSYIGYPQLEAGDRIALTTIYGSTDLDVLNNTIQFNGGWSGTMEGV